MMSEEVLARQRAALAGEPRPAKLRTEAMRLRDRIWRQRRRVEEQRAGGVLPPPEPCAICGGAKGGRKGTRCAACDNLGRCTCGRVKRRRSGHCAACRPPGGTTTRERLLAAIRRTYP